MTQVHLPGCRPEPLGGYLKALGVLRALGQADPGVLGHWQGSVFVVSGSLDEAQLLDFFSRRWSPSPIVSPWNKDAGISESELRDAAKAIAESGDPRLCAYRAVLESARAVLAEVSRLEAAAKVHGRKLEAKATQLVLLRNRLPDDAILWLDAVGTVDDEVRFAPLLGTGGNDGRHEICKRYMESVAQIVTAGRPGSADADRALDWLKAALFEEPTVLEVGAVGMYFPGQADVASSPIGADAVVNPWDYVLAVEGTLLFASALARRAGTDQPQATFPFTFSAASVANAAAAEDEKAYGELWVPLWRNPASLPEVQRLLAEGRLEWNRRQAADPVDAVRAVSALGIDRGIVAFSRHLIVQRRGQSRLAQAVGRVEVRERPTVTILAQADGWVSRLRAAGGSPAIRQALGAYDRAVWAAATRDRPDAYMEVLAAVAACEVAAGASAKARSRLQPIDVLGADRWWPAVDDGSVEVRLAGALASARDGDGASLRHLLRPQARERRLTWRERGAPVEGFGRRPVVAVLADALVARVVALLSGTSGSSVSATSAAGGEGRSTTDPELQEGTRGVQPAFERWSVQAQLSDVAAFVAGDIDWRRFERALGALLVLQGWENVREGRSGQGAAERMPPPGFALLAPFFFPGSIELRRGETVRLSPEAHWPHLLRAGRIGVVLREALVRLRMARREPLVASDDEGLGVLGAGLDPQAVAASLLVPIGQVAAARLLEWVSEGQTEGLTTEPDA